MYTANSRHRSPRRLVFSIVAVLVLVPRFVAPARAHQGEETFPSPLSFGLAAKGIGAELAFDISLSEEDRVLLPLEYQVASKAGYLVILREPNSVPRGRHSPEFLALLKELTKSGYDYIESPSGNPTLVYLIPDAFFGNQEAIDTLLDGAAADEVERFLQTWSTANDDIRRRIDENNQALAGMKDLVSAKAALQNQLDSVNGEVTQLRIEVNALQRTIDSLSDQMSLQAFSSMANASSFKALAINSYDPSKDFFLPIFEHELISIKGKPYDSDSVQNKYMSKELVAALDSLVAKDIKELAKLGLSPFRLASAARTPMNQSAQIKNRPSVAAGMFSSGHVFGMAFDFNTGGTSYSSKNWGKLQKLLSKHGLLLKDSLKTKDPNHVFLTQFVKNRAFANQARLRMLGAYHTAIDSQRALQVAMGRALTKESARTAANIATLNKQLSALNTALGQAQSERNRLTSEKIAKQATLDRKRAEIASRNAMKEKERDRGREWWREASNDRPDKDGYWERYRHMEVHRDGYTGRSTTYENSRGEYWRETSIERDRATGAKPGGSGFRLP